MMLFLGDVGDVSVTRCAGELPGCAVFRDDLAVDKNLAGNGSAVIHAAGDAHVCAKDSLDLYFFLPAAGHTRIGSRLTTACRVRYSDVLRITAYTVYDGLFLVEALIHFGNGFAHHRRTACHPKDHQDDQDERDEAAGPLIPGAFRLFDIHDLWGRSAHIRVGAHVGLLVGLWIGLGALRLGHDASLQMRGNS